jgi:hypothetical protein
MSINNGGVPPNFKKVRKGTYWDRSLVIRHPMRYKTLFSHAMYLRSQGIATTKIIKEIKRIASEQCEPPYRGKELDRLVHQIVTAYEEQ